MYRETNTGSSLKTALPGATPERYQEIGQGCQITWTLQLCGQRTRLPISLRLEP